MLQTVKKGFTLIELLVVITIIGILATGAVSVYTSQIRKARDTTRISSINSLQSGIEQYYQDTSEYPTGSAEWITGTSTTVNDYVPNLAEDPKHNETCNGSRCGYVYASAPDQNGITAGSYEISTGLENQGNIDNKATNDNGEDDNRIESGLLKSGSGGTDINTQQAQATAFAESTASATTNPLVITNGAVVTK